MHSTATADYIMEDPREAMRLELKWIHARGYKSMWRAEYERTRKFFPSAAVQESFCVRCAHWIDLFARQAWTSVMSECKKQSGKIARMRKQTSFEGCASNGFRLEQLRLRLLAHVDGIPEGQRRRRKGNGQSLQTRRHDLLQDLDGQLLWHYPEDPMVQATVEKVVRRPRDDRVRSVRRAESFFRWPTRPV